MYPGLLLNYSCKPYPKTITEQVDKAHDDGFDGIIVHIDQKGRTTDLCFWMEE